MLIILLILLLTLLLNVFKENTPHTKYTIHRIFHIHFEDLLNDPVVKKNGVSHIVLEEVDKMIKYGTLDAGYEIYKCPNCHSFNIICYNTLRKSFMTALLTKMKEYLKSNHESELKKLKILSSSLYKKDKNGFYINAPPMKTKNGKEATVNYIIRYCGRPAMSQNRITNYDYDNKTIDYYYEDHKTN